MRPFIIKIYNEFPCFFMVLFAVFLCISPFFSVWNGEFIDWDDNLNLTRLNNLQSGNALSEIWFSSDPFGYHPLTDTLWYLQKSLWGNTPAVAPYYHRVSLLLYALSLGALTLVLSHLIPSKLARLGILFLFALHPSKVETVAWVTEQKTLLSSLFIWISGQYKFLMIPFLRKS